MQKFIINTDGGSRGNPGQAACGVVITGIDGKELDRLKKTIGVATNNQAEYQALVMGLEWLLAYVLDNGLQGDVHITCRLDSELVVKQIKGEYKMKNEELKPHLKRVQELINEFSGEVSFEHVRREYNKIADQLVNEALDALP